MDYKDSKSYESFELLRNQLRISILEKSTEKDLVWFYINETRLW